MTPGDDTMARMPDAVPAGPNTDPGDQDEVELRKEACTMALYVAICLLAALSAVSEHGDTDELDAFKIVWGTTVGLAVAH